MTVLYVLSRFRDDYPSNLCSRSYPHILSGHLYRLLSNLLLCSLIPHPLPFPLCMSLLLLLLFDTKKKNRDLHLSHTAHEPHVRPMCFLYTSGCGEAL
jgi:hypothetical protein